MTCSLFRAIRPAAPGLLFATGTLLLAGIAAADGQPPKPAAPVPPPGAGFGKQLELTGQLGTGPSMDAVIAGGRLYVLARGALLVASLSQPAAPKAIARLEGLGNVRQLVVRNGIAYITAREDGLFLVDVRRPTQPVLLSHYDTIELATGLAVSGNVAFVACRFPGVELVDITDPKQPRHLSTIRVGEAQSVTVRDGFLYAGVWATRELVICDVRDPRRPAIVSKSALDGFGDGVAVRGSLCYVATGHHQPGKGRAAPDAPGYGRGHGLEIFDVADPARPRWISRIKMPPYYRTYIDTWRVQLSGSRAFVTDAYNGIFVLDVADPKQPRFLAHRQLPLVEQRGDPSPAAGMALGRGYLYIAGAWSDLHVAAAPDLASPPQLEADHPPAIGPRTEPAGDPRFTVYRTEGQVHAAVPWESPEGAPRVLVAAGSAGLHEIELEPIPRALAVYPTDGFAYDVAVNRGTVYVAESSGGLSLWKRGKSGRLERTVRYRPERYPIRQVVVTPDGRYGFLHAGLDRLHVVEFASGAAPRLTLDQQYHGLFYRRPISPALLAGRYALCQWHASGLYTFDTAAQGAPRFTGYHYTHLIGAQNGAAPWGEGWIVTGRDRYFLLAPGEMRPPAGLALKGPAGVEVAGKPSLFGNALFTANAFTGKVVALDVSNPDRPALLGELQLAEPPGLVTVTGDRALVPAGYQGLLVWHYRKR